MEKVGQARHMSRMDSRLRGNDIKGGGNDIMPNVIGNNHRERGNLNLQIFSYSSLITYYANRATS